MLRRIGVPAIRTLLLVAQLLQQPRCFCAHSSTASALSKHPLPAGDLAPLRQELARFESSGARRAAMPVRGPGAGIHWGSSELRCHVRTCVHCTHMRGEHLCRMVAAKTAPLPPPPQYLTRAKTLILERMGADLECMTILARCEAGGQQAARSRTAARELHAGGPGRSAVAHAVVHSCLPPARSCMALPTPSASLPAFTSRPPFECLQLAGGRGRRGLRGRPHEQPAQAASQHAAGARTAGQVGWVLAFAA